MKRKTFASYLEARVAIAALKGHQATNEIAQESMREILGKLTEGGHLNYDHQLRDAQRNQVFTFTGIRIRL
jgi:hypothetical protein